MGIDLKPVSEVRKELNAMLSGPMDHPVYVTQRGRVRGVLLGYHVFERIMDRIEDMLDLCDSELIDDVRRAEMAIKNVGAAHASGELTTLADLKAELAADDAVQHRDHKEGQEAD